MHRNSSYEEKVFLHKLEVYPEVKKELIEKFDFIVIGDQLGLEPEVEVKYKLIFKYNFAENNLPVIIQ